MWTDTDLCWKGGAGGLLLDTGSGPSFLPLPAPVLDQVAQGNNEPGVTTLKLPDTYHNRPTDLPIQDVDIEVCFVCKKCRLAYPSDGPLLAHQRQCYGSNQEDRGAFRIVQTGFECRACNSPVKFKNFIELRGHFDSEHSQNAQNFSNGVQNVQNNTQNALNALKGGTKTFESPLTHEIEDAVNQITLLAAKSAQETQPAQTDSNSNTFCHPSEPKKRFLSPAEVPQTVAGVQH